MIICDYHTHTVFSHGKGSVEDNVKAAIARGLRRVAISEHNAGHVFYGVRGKAWRELKKEVERMNRVYGNKIEVLLGVEANLMGMGRTDLPKDTSMFDCILLGYHKGVIPRDGISLRWTAGLVFGQSEKYAEKNALAIAEALDAHPGILAVSHPGAYVPVDIEVLARACRELNVALELNEGHQSMTIDQIQRAAACGAHFLANSDAHVPEKVGVVTNAMNDAKEAGVIGLVKNRAI